MMESFARAVQEERTTARESADLARYLRTEYQPEARPRHVRAAVAAKPPGRRPRRRTGGRILYPLYEAPIALVARSRVAKNEARPSRVGEL